MLESVQNICVALLLFVQCYPLFPPLSSATTTTTTKNYYYYYFYSYYYNLCY